MNSTSAVYSTKCMLDDHASDTAGRHATYQCYQIVAIANILLLALEPCLCWCSCCLRCILGQQTLNKPVAAQQAAGSMHGCCSPMCIKDTDLANPAVLPSKQTHTSMLYNTAVQHRCDGLCGHAARRQGVARSGHGCTTGRHV